LGTSVDATAVTYEFPIALISRRLSTGLLLVAN
jgi:hypothetical protein